MNSEISAFLHFGYIPRPAPDLPWELRSVLEGRSGESASDVPRRELVEEGVRLLDRMFGEPGSGTHVVPLSGGLDSRAILGGLVKAGAVDRITTATVGTPGTMDYDLAAQVAGKMKIKHAAIDLSCHEVSQKALLRVSREMRSPVNVFESLFLSLVRRKFDEAATYWSGFVGETVSGSHMPRTDSRSWHQARSRFIEGNRAATSVVLTHPVYRPETDLPSSPVVPAELLGLDDQLDFAVRQYCYIHPLLVSEGLDLQTPFLDPEWMRFMLRLPRRHRRKQYLYKEILKRAYPALFSLPDKTSLGLSLTASRARRACHRQGLRAGTLLRALFGDRRKIDPGLNYMDFAAAIRDRDDMRGVVAANIGDLAGRGVLDWLDPEDVLRKHLDGTGDYSDALQVLTSLEIHLKTGRIAAEG